MSYQDEARRLRPLIVKGAASLSDEDALDGIELFDRWAAGRTCAAGERLRHGDKLYRCVQGHTSQVGWEPDKTPALWAEVEKPGQGDTPDDPIPYSGNMELVENKYYSQDGVTYRCFRGTGIPVYNRLADLAGIYVEVVV